MIHTLYHKLARPALFLGDPERVHQFALNVVRRLPPALLAGDVSAARDPRLAQTLWGLPFANPVGLAGGFDKNAECVHRWGGYGFSFVEIGTVTPKPQPGNPRPRLFRYPAEKALVNRMGFNNEGAEAVAKRLERLAERPSKHPCLIGVSLGRQKDTPAGDLGAVERDYITVLKRLYNRGDYFAVNVSSPNTPGLRALQRPEALDRLFASMLAFLGERAGAEKRERRKPLLVKLAPDLGDDEIREALGVIMDRGLDGVIATNTTNQTGGRETGGLGGAPLRERATGAIRLIHETTGGKLPIIGVGGIFTPDDALEKLRAGAALLQVYTGFVYEGPRLANTLCAGVLDAIVREGHENLAEWLKANRGRG